MKLVLHKNTLQDLEGSQVLGALAKWGHHLFMGTKGTI